MKYLAAFVFSLMLAASARAQTLSFTMQGVNPDGKSGYTGTVDLTQGTTGADGSWNASMVTWKVGSAAPIQGLALQVSSAPSMLSISFPGTPVPGVGVATVKRDGVVELLWYIGGEAAGKEIWTPRKQGG